LFLCVFVVVVTADLPPAVQEVLDADQQRVDAMAKGDVAALERLLAAELTMIASDGRVEDKQSLLFAARTKRTVFDSLIATERKPRMMGTTAMVTGVAAMRGVNRKESFDLAVRYTAVYTRREGRWQLVALQETPLPAGGRVIGGESA
jgi:hypothetical protein